MNARQIIESELARTDPASVGNGKLRRMRPQGRPATSKEVWDFSIRNATMNAMMREYFRKHPGSEADFEAFHERLEDEAFKRNPEDIFVPRHTSFNAWWQARHPAEPLPQPQAYGLPAQGVVESVDELHVEDLAYAFVEDTVGRYHFAENWPKVRNERNLMIWLVQQREDIDLAKPIMAHLDQLAAEKTQWVRPETYYLPGNKIGTRKKPKEPKKK